MWVRLRAEMGRFLYIAICYFPPSTSVYATPRGQSPFSVLDDDIWEFSRDGDIILLGDFNAWMGISLKDRVREQRGRRRAKDTEIWVGRLQ